jgi:hypothetical protein
MRRWHPPTHRWTAILIPSGSAGAVFLLASSFFALLANNRPIRFDPDNLGVIGLTMFAFPVGFFLALLPMLVGVTAMHWFGSWNLGLRHPAAWGLAGGGMAAAIVSTIPHLDYHDSLGTAPGFVATGTLCALLARRYVRWPDEKEWQ